MKPKTSDEELAAYPGANLMMMASKAPIEPAPVPTLPARSDDA